MAPLALEFDDFDALRRLLKEHTGMWLGDTKVTFLSNQLGERLRARKISSPREYYHFLKYDPQGAQEIDQLIDAVTINETWFFRETEPIEAWCNLVLPELLKRLGQRVRIWSAACSTGEEPFTIGMHLLERYPTIIAHSEILGTDISQRALALARTAQYDPHSLRRTQPQWREKFFQPAATPGKQSPIDSVRRLVTFGRANLLDASLAGRVGQMDLILCRNVLIYFDEDYRRTALQNLHAALRPGGYFILGQCESLAHDATPFELARLGSVVLYRKPALAVAARPAQATAPVS